MTPLALIECLKLTYDFDLARKVTAQMVEAAYPNVQGDAKLGLMAAIAAGMAFSAKHVRVVDEWSLEASLEFVRLYEEAFSQKGVTLYGYVMVEELFKRVSARILELAGTPPDCLPNWLKHQMRYAQAQAATPVAVA